MPAFWGGWPKAWWMFSGTKRASLSLHVFQKSFKLKIAQWAKTFWKTFQIFEVQLVALCYMEALADCLCNNLGLVQVYMSPAKADEFKIQPGKTKVSKQPFFLEFDAPIHSMLPSSCTPKDIHWITTSRKNFGVPAADCNIQVCRIPPKSIPMHE